MRLLSSMSISGISGNGICAFGNSLRGSSRLLGEGTEVCPKVSEKIKAQEERAVQRTAECEKRPCIEVQET